ncbi:hypothetical protein DL96DRAFT_1718813 [Flagelloscypha sp. PMI_526]|nr:hypothetical protein DL96DRAFT_1718813 [Flagelloscypha sp. PMI_526]
MPYGMAGIPRIIPHRSKAPTALLTLPKDKEEEQETIDPDERLELLVPGSSRHFPVDIAKRVSDLALADDLNTARSLRLTCTIWRDLATPSLFHTISVYERSQILNFQLSPHLAECTRILSVHLEGWYGDGRWFLFEDDFALAMEVFPHLNVLEFVTSDAIIFNYKHPFRLSLRPLIHTFHAAEVPNFMLHWAIETSYVTHVVCGQHEIQMVKHFQNITHLLIFESDSFVFSETPDSSCRWHRVVKILRFCPPTLRLFLIMVQNVFVAWPYLFSMSAVKLILGVTDDRVVVGAPSISKSRHRLGDAIFLWPEAYLARSAKYVNGIWPAAMDFRERRQDGELRSSILSEFSISAE